MLPWHAPLWALLGATLLEVLDFYNDIRLRKALPWCQPLTKDRDPSRPSPSIYFLGSGLRLLMAVGVGAVAAASGMIVSPWIGFTVGVGSPLILQRLAKQLPSAVSDALSLEAAPLEQPPIASGPAESAGPGVDNAP
jgi:hypothetical protein